MLVLAVKENRPRPADPTTLKDEARAELFRSMVAYGGTFTLSGDAITHHIDISWNETWTGTDQLRHIRLEGNKLILTTDPQVGWADGKMGYAVLTWERVE
jgi:hypothetical protein